MTSGESSLLRYAVFGHPVAHSKSPRIHMLFAQQLGHSIEYTAIDLEPGHFAEGVDAFRVAGGRGANVTVPFKRDAYELSTHPSDRARQAGAVNTLRFDPDGSIFGDNTDGTGLVHDLTRNLGVHLRDRNILLLGAGGAVRGVLGPLLRQHPALVVIANRTVARAKELISTFAALGRVEASGFDALKGRRFDLVINGTAASLSDDVLPLPPNLFANRALAYDMMYGEKSRPFLDWAATHGAETVTDGLGKLVEQAAESYFLWHGVRPATPTVIQTLRREG
jgi:shikimate dehydrogenase